MDLSRQQKSLYTGYFTGNAQKTVPLLWPKSCGEKTLNFERLQSLEVLRKLENDGIQEITHSLRFTQTSLYTGYFTGNALNTVIKKPNVSKPLPILKVLRKTVER